METENAHFLSVDFFSSRRHLDCPHAPRPEEEEGHFVAGISQCRTNQYYSNKNKGN
jgi:hypothetical protein